MDHHHISKFSIWYSSCFFLNIISCARTAHDQHSSFAECINAFFSLALIISYAYAYDRPAADTYAHSRVI